MALWISHRGESLDAPENTASAFRLAMSRDTGGMETDIHLTADKVLLCCHDADTKRTCNGSSHIIEETGFDVLRQLDASNGKSEFSGEKLPTFAEALAILKPGKKFYVEIKENAPEVIDAMVGEISKAGISFDCIVMISFHSDIVREYKKRYPQYQALWLSTLKRDENGNFKTAAELIDHLRSLNADGIDIQGNRECIDENFIRAFHEAGFQFAVWTVDDAQDAAFFAAAGVDAVTSNCACAVSQAAAK